MSMDWPILTAWLYMSIRIRAGEEHPDWGTYIFNYQPPEVSNFLVANALFGWKNSMWTV